MISIGRANLLILALSMTANEMRVATAQPNENALLQLEARIPLGEVRGRLDHMAVDLDRRRLFVAELGNDSVGIVDVVQRKTLRTLGGLKEPKGMAYLPATDTLYVANGGDGSLRLFRGAQYEGGGKIDLGDDADNVRVDPLTHRLVVGYGNGGLAIIDPVARSKIGVLPLPAHPESFQINSGRAYVNVPNARIIAVLDLASQKQLAAWQTAGASANFPMALDEETKRVLVMFRKPAKLGIFDIQGGISVAATDACGDADDLFVDPKRRRIYVSCGDGMIDVFDARTYQRMTRVPTVSGARTSLFVPDLDRLFLAVRAAAAQPAAIWVFRPSP